MKAAAASCEGGGSSGAMAEAAAEVAADSSTSLFGCFPEICQMLRGPSSARGERNLRERFGEIS